MSCEIHLQQPDFKETKYVLSLTDSPRVMTIADIVTGSRSIPHQEKNPKTPTREGEIKKGNLPRQIEQIAHPAVNTPANDGTNRTQTASMQITVSEAVCIVVHFIAKMPS
jgi:hypothetical protein